MFKIILFTAISVLATFCLHAQLWLEKAPNSNNPHDSIGVYHNWGMAECSNSAGVTSQCALNYGATIYPYLYESETLDFESIVDQAASAVLEDPINYVPEYLSSLGQAYASQLMSMVDNIEESSEIDAVVELIKELESDILNDDNLEDYQKKSLLCASSIARHSLYYWLENVDSTGEEIVKNHFLYYDCGQAFSGFQSLYSFDFDEMKTLSEGSRYRSYVTYIHNNYTEPVSFKPGWLRRLLRIVVGDIVGAFIGAGVGSLVPGCGICPVAGAFFGAMSGSLASADAEGILEQQ